MFLHVHMLYKNKNRKNRLIIHNKKALYPLIQALDDESDADVRRNVKEAPDMLRIKAQSAMSTPTLTP